MQPWWRNFLVELDYTQNKFHISLIAKRDQLTYLRSKSVLDPRRGLPARGR